jgi:hypothetical protein
MQLNKLIGQSVAATLRSRPLEGTHTSVPLQGHHLIFYLSAITAIVLSHTMLWTGGRG